MVFNIAFDVSQAKACVPWLPLFADVLASRLYFYYSLSYELPGGLDEIRGLVFFCHDYLIIRD